MNRRQKLVQQRFLNDEEAVIKRLKTVYNQSLTDINKKVAELDSSIAMLQKALNDIDGDDIGDLALAVLKGKNYTPQEAQETIRSMLQSKVYQKKYQAALQKQVGDIMDKMQAKEYKAVADYLNECYENGFIGTMFDLQGQGIPLCFPLDQEQMVRAVQLDSKISKGLYTRLGEDISLLKKKIAAQVSRGISTGMSYQQVAQQLAGVSNIGFNNAVRIARTEGHRIQCQAGMDACEKAKNKGADVVKQWDAALDARTRDSHAKVDGEIRELHQKFSNGLMFPGDPSGRAAEVINCRCALLQRARWALDEEELQTLQDRAAYFGLDKTNNFEEYKQKYVKANDILRTPGEVGEKAEPFSKRGIEIDSRLKEYTKRLSSEGQYISDVAGAFKPQDLAILTTETGVEYTSLTIGKKSYLIRGMEKSTTIPRELRDALIKNKGTLDSHSHPFIGDLIPSEADKDFLKLLTWQKESVIIEPTQNAVKFTADGMLQPFHIQSERDDLYWEMLFGGESDA